MTEMAENIYEIVSRRRHVSFVELENLIPGFKKEMPPGVAEVYYFEAMPQIIIWINLSDEAKEALEELRKSRKVFLNPCESLVYMVSGKMLKFPIPKRKPRKDSKKEYWVPCVLDIEPLPEKRKSIFE